jgi:Na+-transporting NADH:ubiquinone oxidoreductase subunit NqrE
MATVSQSASAHQGVHFSGHNGLADKYFYFAMSLLVAAIVVWGFSHTVNENLFYPAVPRPLILWFHAIAFSAWVLFFIFQSTLVRTHNVKWHRFFGWFGAGLGTAMVLLGVTTAIIMGRFDTYVKHESGSDAFLIVPFYDVAAFATLFGLAVLWRKKPEFHRRLIFIATCGLLAAAFGRFPYLASHNLFYGGVDALILLGVVRDLIVNRRIHKVYLIALPVLIACQVFVVYTMASGSAWWVKIADKILG